MIVDASIAVKWLVIEDDSPKALSLIESGPLQAPDLLFAEIANVMWKRWRRGQSSEMPIGLDTLPHLFSLIVPSATLMPRAASLAVELDHPAYDCFYLAMAIAEDVPLVTADRRFLAVCAGTAHASRVRSLT